MSEEKIKMCHYNKTEPCLVFNISGFPMTQKEICNACKKNKTTKELQAENKRLREAIKDIKFEAKFNGNDESVQKMFMISKQALGGTCD